MLKSLDRRDSKKPNFIEQKYFKDEDVEQEEEEEVPVYNSYRHEPAWEG